MTFRHQLRNLKFAAMPASSEVLHDIFDRHIEAWHTTNSRAFVWDFLGLTLEEYSDIITCVDGLEEFFHKVCNEA